MRALVELGPRQLAGYGLYRLGITSGHYRRIFSNIEPSSSAGQSFRLASLLPLPRSESLIEVLGHPGKDAVIAAADEVVAGKIRLFGGTPVSLDLHPPLPLRHWTEYEPGTRNGVFQDVKIIWEPARLGWAILLGRAYVLSKEERYAETFWKLLADFLGANPPYLGWNWVSAQEAALRLLAMAYCWSVFAGSECSSDERAGMLALAAAQHARRIPPTMVYGRSQNNNHLLSEAAGLFTAGLLLPEHPMADDWRETGWRWFERGIAAQISEEGVYSQHSANYHRLMLQLALWMDVLARASGRSFSPKSRERLGAATRWLIELMDYQSGSLPNLGPNDGAYILPFTMLAFEDYRPVIQSSAAAFLGSRITGQRTLGRDGALVWATVASNRSWRKTAGFFHEASVARSPIVLKSSDKKSWAYFRTARFNGRPGHADQLHLDLWWQGMNVAIDPGTYLYNAPPPWDNALAGSDVHNTVTVDGRDQMQRVGRFLFLHRAQASLLELKTESPEDQRVTAQHDGYRSMGLTHRRTVKTSGGSWLVEDEIQQVQSRSKSEIHTACLHWLLPDWSWEIDEKGSIFLLRLVSPCGQIRLLLQAIPAENAASPGVKVQIVRAGELIYGDGTVKPVWGWNSKYYNEKIPALSVRLSQSGACPLKFFSEWKLG